MNKELIEKLDSFDASERRAALVELAAEAGERFPPAGDHFNCHAHTFFSYNAEGYSPTRFAWEAKQAGFAFAGMVDFDVLDGLEEFQEACDLLKLKGCVSIETRTYLPEFSDKVINSPGEPGVVYHMGLGFTTTDVPASAASFLRDLRERSASRNRGLVERVNAFLSPVELDYEKDVLCLTPSGNATERHICLAYARKAAEVFPNEVELAKFWSEKLGVAPAEPDLPEGGALQGLIRAKTMKRGGVGYVQPGVGAFPKLSDMNRFVLECGAIPALTWLDGTTDGEQDIGRLLETEMSSGAAAVALIPDRNYTSGVKDDKLANLIDIVERAESLGLPVLVGTEMNSPGQKFVDDCESEELKPLWPVFLKGARIVYAHSVLQKHSGKGYLSEWAHKKFADVFEKNAFYERFGREYQPGDDVEEMLAKL